jgi:hypothetical protein
MPGSSGVMRTSVRYVKWGLPWIFALAVSASLAYAMAVAVASGPVTHEPKESVATAPSWSRPSVSEKPEASTAASNSLEGSETANTCDTTGVRTLYVGQNSWIPVVSGGGPCPQTVSGLP